jgi:hypothetical protein
LSARRLREGTFLATSSISSTYRGYRRQALYVLWRVLTDSDSSRRVFQPEGEEDLAVIDIDNRLLEVIQVKDYSSPLTLSDFKPSSADGFFARAHRRLSSHPDCQVWIASFGPIGSELASAIADPGSQRRAVAVKLTEKNPAIPLASCEALLARLNGRVVHLHETVLRNDIQRVLAPTIAGAHDDTAIELLLFWIFDASEQGRSITRSALLQQLERIGAYLSALRDHSSEWHVAVGPLVEQELSPHERDVLRASFRLGVQASWQHILAEVDSTRPRRLMEVHEQFRTHQAVVIRGASGQGKSTLAFRYIRDL